MFIDDDSFDYAGLDRDGTDCYIQEEIEEEIEEELGVQPKHNYIELNGNIHSVIHKLYTLRYSVTEVRTLDREIVDDMWVDEQIKKSLYLLASVANKGEVSEDGI